MAEQRELVWGHYRSQEYTLVSYGSRWRGTEIDLVCERMREVAFVTIRPDPPTPGEQVELNRALCLYLRWHRASGVYVRWDRAWAEAGVVQVTENAFPVVDPDAVPWALPRA